MQALEAVDIVKKYGERAVLNGFSLTLEPGGFEALMGPSGAGKSTFLHLAAGLIAADSGSIAVGGVPVTDLSDAAAAKFRRRHVGVVFQDFNLLEDKTVRENIVLPLKLDRAPVDMPRFWRLSDILGLSDKLDRRPTALSGGERQRVAIARALLPEPDIVLADEPTGNLDTRAAKGICELLQRLNTLGKSAILVVTHDPVVAAATRKVNFLKDGRLAASYPTQGDPARVSQLYLESYS